MEYRNDVTNVFSTRLRPQISVLFFFQSGCSIFVFFLCVSFLPFVLISVLKLKLMDLPPKYRCPDIIINDD